MKKCSVHIFEQTLKKGDDCQIIDVREPAEYVSERIEGMVSLPLSSLSEAKIKDLKKEKPTYILCRSGSRACKAADQLARWGFLDLHVVEGGLQAWIDAGKPIVHGSVKTWSLDRQVRFVAGFLVIAGIILSELLHPYWIGLSGFVGAGLIFSAITDTCGMAMILARMPWNKVK